MNATDKIRCPKRERPVAADACIEGYTDATALGKKNAPCYQCEHGAKMPCPA